MNKREYWGKAWKYQFHSSMILSLCLVSCNQWEFHLHSDLLNRGTPLTKNTPEFLGWDLDWIIIGFCISVDTGWVFSKVAIAMLLQLVQFQAKSSIHNFVRIGNFEFIWLKSHAYNKKIQLYTTKWCKLVIRNEYY